MKFNLLNKKMEANQFLAMFIWLAFSLLIYSIATEDKAWIFATSVALIVEIITLIITTKR